MTLLELLLRDEEIGPKLVALTEEFEALEAKTAPDEACPLCEAKGWRWVATWPFGKPPVFAKAVCCDCNGTGVLKKD